MNKREAIERYRELYRGLNSIILEWDPYGLYAVGELDDEFSDEVTSILAELQAVQSESDAIEAVHRVFAKAFSEHDFSPVRCAEVGRKIYAWWRAQGRRGIPTFSPPTMADMRLTRATLARSRS